MKANRKGWAMLFALVLIGIAARPAAFGQAPKEAIFRDVTVAVSALDERAGIQVVAREIAPKDHIKGGLFEGKFVLLNLDIFIVGKLQVDQDGSSAPKLPFPEITVIIPDAFIANLTRKDFSEIKDLFLLVSDKWIRVDRNNTFVSDFGKGGKYFWFKLKKWPLEDLLIGCW